MNNAHLISPLDIGDFFLRSSEGNGITNLKLNKLIYIAHGYYWGNVDKPLITNGEFAEAWKYGPVYRSIYNIFGRFGADVIPVMYAGMSTRVESFGEDKTEFLNLVWERFKDVSPWELVQVLHKKDSPWYLIWHRGRGKYTSGLSIPDYLTRVYYINLINRYKENNGE